MWRPLLCTVCIVGILLLLLYIRMRMEIYSLCRQLEEIQRGSRIELTTGSRQKPLLMLYNKLNHVLTWKNEEYIRYSKAEKQLKQNITGLAHDIRTPLTGAAGYVQLARESELPDRREHYLNAAENRLTELEDMLEEMFLYTKLTSEDFALTMKKIQVLPLLSDCLFSLYTRFEEAGTSPEVVFETESFYVNAEEEALRRVFLNLIQNALIHGIGGILITQKGNALVFENSLPPDSSLNTEHIFDRFYKGEASRRKGSSGLGLFIVKELMKKMDGDVEAGLKEDRLLITLYFNR